MRMSFANNNNKPEGVSAVLTPLKVSRATSKIEDVKNFYTADIGAQMIYE